MTNYTKATWIAVGSRVKVEEDAMQDICNCNPAYRDIGKLCRPYSEICANALLIAAAPDMLAALQECHDVMEYMSEYYIPIALTEQVKAAIDKAVGE